MKKSLLLNFLLVFFMPSLAFATIENSGLVWEVRTTGNANNGGCYDLVNDGGTDYSQQDSAQLNLTDLAANTGGSTLTSATGGFTSAMVDNCIKIYDAGTNFVADFYEITAFTDTNTVTLDRDPTNGTNASGGSGNVGGALIHPDNVDSVSGIAGGNRIYVESGTYTGTVWTVNTASDSDNGYNKNIHWIGYDTTRDDNPTGANRPVFDGESTLTNCLDSDGSRNRFFNFRFTGATSNNIIGNDETFFFNVRSDNSGGSGIDIDNACVFIGVETDLNSARGMRCDNIGIYYSYSHDNGSEGVEGVNAIDFISNFVSESNTGTGALSATGCCNFAIIESVFYNNTGTGESGINYQLSNQSRVNRHILLNISSSDNTDNAVDFNQTTVGNFLDFSNYNGHTTELNNVLEWQHTTGDIDPGFTDEAGADFTITASSALDASGISIDTFTSITGTYDHNIGVYMADPDASVGGGGTNAKGAVSVAF